MQCVVFIILHEGSFLTLQSVIFLIVNGSSFIIAECGISDSAASIVIPPQPWFSEFQSPEWNCDLQSLTATGIEIYCTV
jgi:hypothetical protein